MTTGRGIVLDANILIRAALGRRVRTLLEAYEDSVAFYAPDVCFDDAREYIPRLFGGRGDDPEAGLAVIDRIRLLVQPVDEALYRDFGPFARERMTARDVEDWPVAAVALMLGVPVWTEDRDFFGSGIATWTTDRVELYLRGRHAYMRLRGAAPHARKTGPENGSACGGKSVRKERKRVSLTLFVDPLKA
jgi:predicted nucleic acid-binding protein